MKENYLMNKAFNIYISGVYDGQVLFSEKELELCNVDRKTQVQLKRKPFTKDKKASLIDYHHIYKDIEIYTGCKWEEGYSAFKRQSIS